MPVLMATCSRCRSEVNTGISADEQTVQQLEPKSQVFVRCDHCDERQIILVHELRLDNAA